MGRPIVTIDTVQNPLLVNRCIGIIPPVLVALKTAVRLTRFNPEDLFPLIVNGAIANFVLGGNVPMNPAGSPIFTRPHLQV